MPMVIPVVASFAAAGGAIAAAGGFAAAMGTLTGFMAIAGAALTTIGALSGKEDVLKVGSLLTLGSGLAGLASNAGSAAGGAAAGEAAAEGAATLDFVDAASSVMESPSVAGDVFSTGMLDGAAASTSGYAGGAAAATAGEQLLSDAVSTSAAGTESMAGSAADTGASSLFEYGKPAGGDPFATGGLDAAGKAPNSIYGAMAEPGTTPSALMNVGGQPSPASLSPPTTTAPPAVQQAGAAMDQSTLSKLLASAEKFANQHKTLLNFGGQMLQGMYGPQAEQMDFQKSLFNMRQKNLNSPIALGPLRPTTRG